MGGEIFVDRKRIGWRGEIADPIGDPFQAGPVAGGRRDAGAHRGAAVTLLQRHVVTVPMQVHFETFALALIPDRRKIRRANSFLLRKLIGREIEISLQRVEGVDSPRTPLRLLFDEIQPIAQGQDPFAHEIDAVETQHQADRSRVNRPDLHVLG